jgi:hypothetical protein
VLDLAAPILPGRGAGGVALLDELRLYVGEAVPDNRRLWKRSGVEVVRYGPMTFTLRDGLVIGMGVGRGYTGTIESRIGIDSTLEEATRALGPLDTGDRVVRIEGRPGVGFDRTQPTARVAADPDGLCTHLLATIQGIAVWADVEPWGLF